MKNMKLSIILFLEIYIFSFMKKNFCFIKPLLIGFNAISPSVFQSALIFHISCL